jgi:preprotein translocase subunit SecB
MSIVSFHLDQYRFDMIEANCLAGEPSANQLIEMRFEVGFHEKDEPDDRFDVTLKLNLYARNQGEEREPLLKATARGAFRFAEGETPYAVKEPLERLYATTLLYGAVRPTLDAIVGNIGLRGLAMPLNLPLGEEGRLPEIDDPT